MALAMLAEAFSEKTLTPVKLEAYHRSLLDIPIPVLNHAVKLAIESSTFFPRVAELRTYCEQARVELRAAIVFDPIACGEGCSLQGFTEEKVNGVLRMVRCSCWKLTQAKVAQLEVPAQPIALPAGGAFSRIGDQD